MSAIVTTVYALNEYSASAATTHSAFLLSDGDEIVRSFNIPANTWNVISVYAKVALYSNPLPTVDLVNTRFAMGVCSQGKSMNSTGKQHVCGIYMGNDDFHLGTWAINGWVDGGSSSGSLSTTQTNPPGIAWVAGEYVNRGFSYIGGASAGSAGGSACPLIFYNTQWNSNFSCSNGFPLQNLVGYNWEAIGFTLYKTGPSGSNGPQTISITGHYQGTGKVSTATGPFAMNGLNIPKPVYRTSAVNDQYSLGGSTAQWNNWFKNLTNSNDSETGASGDYGHGALGGFNETISGSLNCVNFQWQCASGVKLLIRDIVVILRSEAPVYTPPPLAPVLTSVVSGSSIVTWVSSSNDQAAFVVQRSTDGVVYNNYTNTGPTILTYTDTGVTDGNTYYYRIGAYNSLGTSSFSNVGSINFPVICGFDPTLTGSSYAISAYSNGTISSSIGTPSSSAVGTTWNGVFPYHYINSGAGRYIFEGYNVSQFPSQSFVNGHVVCNEYLVFNCSGSVPYWNFFILDDTGLVVYSAVKSGSNSPLGTYASDNATTLGTIFSNAGTASLTTPSTITIVSNATPQTASGFPGFCGAI